MKVLVTVAAYPSETKFEVNFVHTRNLYYMKNGWDVTVLNFSAESDYVYEGISVITLKSYKQNRNVGQYDVLLVHQANIRNHYIFLKKYEKDFSRIAFFYHGHEVLKLNKVYPQPYSYVRKNRGKYIQQDIYDSFKLLVWRHYLPKVKDKSHYIFVSYWMYEQFLRWTRINKQILEGKCSITYNSVAEEFERLNYDECTEKKYDFVTIRWNLDGSKYCIDVVNRLAFNTPNAKFLIIGKGKFFEVNRKAPNVEWRDENMSHQNIADILQQARFALMPTRTDAQGLMMCEMAAFGIPVITSDIPVCHEVFDGFDNVYFINNNDLDLDLKQICCEQNRCKKDRRYFVKNTAEKEMEIIEKLKGR